MRLAVIAAAAIGILAASPALAQTTTRADLAGFAKPSNPERRAYLESLLKARKLPYEVVAFEGGQKDKPETGSNVVVTLGRGKREIILAAHYDAERPKSGKLVDGVVDNAGSALALVQAAERLSKQRLRHKVRIIFFDQEEYGLVGSRAYLKARDTASIAAAVNFDVNGYGDTVIYGLPAGKDTIATLALRRVCAARTLECLAFPQYPPSDDLSFLAAGVPVVSIGQQPAKDAHQMWLLLNAGKDAGMEKGVLPSVFRIIHTEADNMSVIDEASVHRAAMIAVDMVADLDRTLR
jgi:Zn-dependent M28 family amino/carboxypeptidase